LIEFAGAKISPKNPIMLVSAPGFDASYKVELLAKQVNKKYTAVAIGSPEAFGLVDTAIRNAAKSGSWVLLKNVHLAPAWLAELEKKIYNMTLDSNFRLFMTMENNPKVPSTLLRVLMFWSLNLQAALKLLWFDHMPNQLHRKGRKKSQWKENDFTS